MSALALIAAAALVQSGPAPAALSETPFTFTAESGETTGALRGDLQVSEDWSDPDSRMITLSYVRFPATTDNPGDPIIYLAGGPGGSGSGTAQGRRFPLFMAMRAHGDVIAFDQRGTGDSTALPACRSSETLATDEGLSDEQVADAYRRAALECRDFWRGEGVAIKGYTTLDSVADLSALRRHLGAERLDLWGISYGSHLALAAIDAIPDEIDRVIIASAEGLDQTVKRPARTRAYFERLQAALDTQPEARARYGDILSMIDRVQARLAEAPIMMELEGEGGEAAPFLFQLRHLQTITGYMISDPSNAVWLLQLYESLDAGVVGYAQFFAGRYFSSDGAITLRAMPTAMDVASGISPERLARFEAEAPQSPAGRYLNFPMPQLNQVWPDVDLGSDFRDGPGGDTPVLLLTGTLDGRTYMEGQAEAVAGLSEVTQVTVVNAGHNLFMTSPEVGAAMDAWLKGEAVPGEIVVELPDFAGE